MRRVACFAAVVVACLACSTFGTERQRLLMDDGWRFTLNDPPDAGTVFDFPEARDLSKARPADIAAEPALEAARQDPAAINLGGQVSFVQPSFNDGQWRSLDLPHDWVVELPFDSRADVNHGFKAISPKIGNTIGWYRRSFNLSAEDKGSTLWVEFDGVYRNSVVWLNGHCLGREPSGYSSFWYDISKAAIYGGANELVVRVDATRTEGWFYEGAGIYRHVWLVKTDPVHVAHWGTFVTSDVEGPNAIVTARTTVRNDQDSTVKCQVVSTIVDAENKTVVESKSPVLTVAAGSQSEIGQALRIPHVNLWSLDTPYMYKLLTTVQVDGKTTDSGYQTPFGVRTIRFDANDGFFLNGQRVEIKGTCNHQDHAGVGSALPDRLQYYRVEKLKEMGSNAYRTSHNDPTPELLDACDKLGMLVMDEHRLIGMTPEILGEVRGQVMRDRNHPSVFIWSIGNEEPTQASDLGVAIGVAMQNVVHQLDPTRLCTQAMNNGWGRGLSDVIDVQGFNYLRQGGGTGRGTPAPQATSAYHAMDDYHAAYPNRPAIGTEEASTLSTRGIYADDRAHGYESAYDVDYPRWGTTAEQWWPYYVARPWAAGAFVWTGFDYRGEPTPYRWPCISSQFGIMDTCGFPKDNFYYYQAWWSGKPVLHLLPHWNWAGKEGQPIDVWCYSNYPSVELFLNGTSLGKQDMPVNSHLEWKVPYTPGTLEARAYKGDQVVATTQVQTTGPAAKLILTPDRMTISEDGRDVSVVSVAVADADGRTVPTAGNLVKFTINGGGRIIGVGNGEPSSHEADKASQRSAFAGLCMAIVQSMPAAADGISPVPITLTASSEGLARATVTLQAVEGTPTPSVP
jgi:beta-galactosidase